MLMGMETRTWWWGNKDGRLYYVINYSAYFGYPTIIGNTIEGKSLGKFVTLKGQLKTEEMWKQGSDIVIGI